MKLRTLLLALVIAAAALLLLLVPARRDTARYEDATMVMNGEAA